MYKKVDTNLNFVEREKEIREFWKAHDIAQKAIDQREGCDTFTFYDGPPTANGKPHIGSGVIFPCRYARPALTFPGSLPLSLQSTLSIDAFTC